MMLAATDMRLFSTGVLVVIAGLALFGGSIYIILANILGKKMAYFLEATCFFAFLTLMASIWTFGFWSQGPDTPTNLGPQGTQPHWQAVAGGVQGAADQYPVSLKYPAAPWVEPNAASQASVGTVTTAIQQYMADAANKQAGITVQQEIPVSAGGRGPAEYPPGKEPFLATDFTVQDVRFTTVGDKSLAAGVAFYNGGGPEITVIAVHEPGMVWLYSWIFLAVGIIGFLFHLPFLDREEKKRKKFLTSRPATWRAG